MQRRFVSEGVLALRSNFGPGIYAGYRSFGSLNPSGLKTASYRLWSSDLCYSCCCVVPERVGSWNYDAQYRSLVRALSLSHIHTSVTFITVIHLQN